MPEGVLRFRLQIAFLSPTFYFLPSDPAHTERDVTPELIILTHIADREGFLISNMSLDKSLMDLRPRGTMWPVLHVMQGHKVSIWVHLNELEQLCTTGLCL